LTCPSLLMKIIYSVMSKYPYF